MPGILVERHRKIASADYRYGPAPRLLSGLPVDDGDHPRFKEVNEDLIAARIELKTFWMYAEWQ